MESEDDGWGDYKEKKELTATTSTRTDPPSSEVPEKVTVPAAVSSTVPSVPADSVESQPIRVPPSVKRVSPAPVKLDFFPPDRCVPHPRRFPPRNGNGEQITGASIINQNREKEIVQAMESLADDEDDGWRDYEEKRGNTAITSTTTVPPSSVTATTSTRSVPPPSIVPRKRTVPTAVSHTVPSVPSVSVESQPIPLPSSVKHVFSAPAKVPSMVSHSEVASDTGPPTVPEAPDTGPSQPPTVPEASDTGPSQHSTVPVASDTGPPHPSTVPVASDTGPSQHSTVPVASDTGPLHPSTVPEASDTGPSQHSTVPVASDTGPPHPSTVPEASDTGPSQHSTVPVASDTGPPHPSTVPHANSTSDGIPVPGVDFFAAAAHCFALGSLYLQYAESKILTPRPPSRVHVYELLTRDEEDEEHRYAHNEGVTPTPIESTTGGSLGDSSLTNTAPTTVNTNETNGEDDGWGTELDSSSADRCSVPHLPLFPPQNCGDGEQIAVGSTNNQNREEKDNEIVQNPRSSVSTPTVPPSTLNPFGGAANQGFPPPYFRGRGRSFGPSRGYHHSQYQSRGGGSGFGTQLNNTPMNYPTPQQSSGGFGVQNSASTGQRPPQPLWRGRGFESSHHRSFGCVPSNHLSGGNQQHTSESGGFDGAHRRFISSGADETPSHGHSGGYGAGVESMTSEGLEMAFVPNFVTGIECSSASVPAQHHQPSSCIVDSFVVGFGGRPSDVTETAEPPDPREWMVEENNNRTSGSGGVGGGQRQPRLPLRARSVLWPATYSNSFAASSHIRTTANDQEEDDVWGPPRVVAPPVQPLPTPLVTRGDENRNGDSNADSCWDTDGKVTENDGDSERNKNEEIMKRRHLDGWTEKAVEEAKTGLSTPDIEERELRRDGYFDPDKNPPYIESVVKKVKMVNLGTVKQFLSLPGHSLPSTDNCEDVVELDGRSPVTDKKKKKTEERKEEDGASKVTSSIPKTERNVAESDFKEMLPLPEKWTYGMLLDKTFDKETNTCTFTVQQRFGVLPLKLNATVEMMERFREKQVCQIRWQVYGDELKIFPDPPQILPCPRLHVRKKFLVKLLGVMAYMDATFYKSLTNYSASGYMKNYRYENTWPIWFDEIGVVHIPFSHIHRINSMAYGGETQVCRSLRMAVFQVEIELNGQQKFPKLVKGEAINKAEEESLKPPRCTKRFTDLVMIGKHRVKKNGVKDNEPCPMFMLKSESFPNYRFEIHSMQCQPDINEKYEVVNETDFLDKNIKKKYLEGIFYPTLGSLPQPDQQCQWEGLGMGSRRWMSETTEDRVYNWRREQDLLTIRKISIDGKGVNEAENKYVYPIDTSDETVTGPLERPPRDTVPLTFMP